MSDQEVTESELASGPTVGDDMGAAPGASPESTSDTSSAADNSTSPAPTPSPKPGGDDPKSLKSQLLENFGKWLKEAGDAKKNGQIGGGADFHLDPSTVQAAAVLYKLLDPDTQAALKDAYDQVVNSKDAAESAVGIGDDASLEDATQTAMGMGDGFDESTPDQGMGNDNTPSPRPSWTGAKEALEDTATAATGMEELNSGAGQDASSLMSMDSGIAQATGANPVDALGSATDMAEGMASGASNIANMMPGLGG